VTILIDALPPVCKTIFDLLVSIISIVLFSVISYKLLDSVASVLKNGRTTEVFKVPYQYIYYAIIFGLVVMVIVFIYAMIKELLFRQSSSKKPEKENVNAQ
jgi:TRAP-type C4-dicarboxylate transport system permease small subunit